MKITQQDKKEEMLMFKNTNWIQVYRKAVTIIAILHVVFGILAGISDWMAWIIDVDIFGDTFFDFLIWVIPSCIAGFLEYMSGMLIADYLENVEKIAKNTDRIPANDLH